MTRLSELEREPFNALLLEIAAVFATEGKPGGTTAADRLRAATTRPYAHRQAEEKPLQLIKQVCVLDNAVDWAQLVQDCAPLLDWEHWQGGGLSKEISSSLYTTELIGPDGHIQDETVRVGLLVSDVGTDYPLSNHAGEETYFVIAGEAEWVLGDGPYRRVPPGHLVHHPAWALHGRRTRTEPFLGAWRWSGDLDLKSFSVAE